MEKLTIKITIPKPENKWNFNIGIGRYTRSSATDAYAVIERKLKGKVAAYSASSKGVIKNKDEVINEAEDINFEDAMFTLACFLEDYLGKEFCSGRQKKYRPEAFIDCQN